MAEIVNLRRVRKAKARADKSAEAEANRVKHGVSKAEHNLAKARSQKSKHDVESHRLLPKEGD
jgi:hypothetical protein